MPKIICNGVQNKGFGADAVTTGMQIGGKKMPRYIDAEKIEYDEHRKIGLGIDYGINESDTYYTTTKEKIDTIPTADVAEVRHGKWKQKAWIDETMEVHEDILVTKCSECGMRTYWLKGEKLWDFCPNCGARMDGERRDDV